MSSELPHLSQVRDQPDAITQEVEFDEAINGFSSDSKAHPQIFFI